MMKEHIKKYATESEYLQNGANDLDLEQPFVAFVEDYNGSGSTTHFKEDYTWVEANATAQYESLLMYLWNKVNELASGITESATTCISNDVYLSETEYDKLVQGLEAYDIDGNVILTSWDDTTVTYFVYEDENTPIYENTNSYVDEIVDGNATLENVTIDSNGYIVLTGASIDANGYIVFTESERPSTPNTGSYIDEITGGNAVISNAEIVDGYVSIEGAYIDNNGYLVFDSE